MKNGKKPNKKQCIMLDSVEIGIGDWLIVKDTSTELLIKHRESGDVRSYTKNIYRNKTKLSLLE